MGLMTLGMIRFRMTVRTWGRKGRVDGKVGFISLRR